MGTTDAPGHSIADYVTGYTEFGRLRGFGCPCGFKTATWVLACPRCGGRNLTDVDLSGRGEVIACSVQHVPSDEFLNEAPYAYVVVDLAGGGRITGWVAGVADPADLPLGTRVHFHPSYKPGVQFVRD